MSLSDFTLLRPRKLEEAVGMIDARARSAATRILAGGTDLLPSMRQKLFEPEYLLDIRQLNELRGIRETEEGIEIGALTTLSEIEHSPIVRERCPLLTEAACTVATPVIRNMATIGGNVCLDTRCLWYNQSFAWRKSCGFCIKKDGDLCHVAPGGTKCWAAFSGDTPAALLCLEAQIEISGIQGIRRIPLREFYTGEGDNYRKLQADELLTQVILPRSSWGYEGVYSKLRIRGSIDYPLAGVAVAVKRSLRHLPMEDTKIEDIKIALTGISPAPLLVPGLTHLARNGSLDEDRAEYAGQLAARAAKPLTTSALTPEYRREMVRVFTKRALLALASAPR